MKVLALVCVLMIPVFVGCAQRSRSKGPRAILDSGEHAVTKELQQLLTPQEIVELLKEGNRRYVDGTEFVHNFSRQRQETASEQYPVGIVLSCIDSRVSPEIVFDGGIGDLFDVRVAGNFVNEDILGSMEYACAVAGSKLILVIGHTGCGAVKGAVDDVRLGNLTGMLQKLKPAVNAVQDVPGERTSKNKKLVDAAARKNVELTIGNIRRMSPVLRKLEDDEKILITGSMYDVKTGKVDFFD